MRAETMSQSTKVAVTNKHCAGKTAAGESRPGVTILFTSMSGTRAALERARAWAKDLDIRIRLLVLEVVPFPLPLDEPPIPGQALVQALWPSLSAATVPIRVQVFLCRDFERALVRVFDKRSTVFLGTVSRWPFGREGRIARLLKKQGHQVLWVRARKAGSERIDSTPPTGQWIQSE
jgi:hypothetical protein